MSKVTMLDIKQQLANGIIKPMPRQEYLGKTLNPRKVHGWKDAYIEAISKINPMSIEEFNRDFGIDISGETQKEAIESITMMIKIEGIGTSPTSCYDNAVKRASHIFTNAVNHNYENKTALLWERIDPNWVKVACVRISPKRNLYFIYH